MKMTYLLPILLLSMLCMACSDSESCVDVDYNNTFSVEEDGQYCFPDGSALTVVGFRNEFCPCEAVCVWQGQMIIEMEWTDGTEVVEFEYRSDDNPNFDNSLPNGAVISDLDDDIVYVTPCTLANGNPDIIGAKITVTK